jgi:hypothetical protein
MARLTVQVCSTGLGGGGVEAWVEGRTCSLGAVAGENPSEGQGGRTWLG